MIYLDTCILIYLVEDPGVTGKEVAESMKVSSDRRFAISPLVRMEVLVKPLRDGDVMLHRRYERAFSRLTLLALDAPAFDQAALLRGRFGLRTPDALHLSCAQLHDCTALWTNDKRLREASRGLSTDLWHDS